MTAISVPQQIPPVPEVDGDPASVEDFAAQLLRASATFDDLDFMAGNEQRPSSGWDGAGADAYSTRAGEVGTDAAAKSLALRTAARAVQVYGDELDRCRRERELIADDRTSFHNEVEELRVQIAAATEADRASLQQWADHLHDRRAQIVEDVATLATSLAANEQALRTKLARYSDLRAARLSVSLGYEDAHNMMSWTGAPGTGATPQQVADWWEQLTEDQRVAVIATYPELIGAANGLPAEVRDEANRLLLDNDLATLAAATERGWLTDSEREIRDNVLAAQEALADADSTIDRVTGGPVPSFLTLYQPAAFGNDGAIAISVGNPDTADNVTTFVPGITTDGTSAGTYVDAVQAIYESARLSDHTASTSATMWIGYDAPSGADLGNTPTEGAAIAGGDRLADYVDGVVATRGTDQPHLTVIGHSYGSTTMAHAASDHGLPADDLVFLGSPGAGGGVDEVSDLGGPEVWVGNASRDLVPALADDGWFGSGSFFGGGLGNDVAEDTFGAHRFQAESPERNSTFRNTTDHGRYWDDGSESLFNLGQIVTGNDAEVLMAEPVHDPWWGPPQDPEWDRPPTVQDPH